MEPEGGTARRVVVSVHDVAPSTLTEVRWLLARLDDLGVEPRVLNVIPNEAWQSDLRGHPEVADLLRAEAARGSEIVLHGYAHRRAGGQLGGRLVDRLRARLFAGDAAEFLELDDAAAAARVRDGLEVLRAIGIEAAGFCAPGWLSRPGLPAILRAAGLRYLVSFLRLTDLGSGARWRVPAVGYMGTGGVDERLVSIERGLVLAARRQLTVIRVFLHPQGAPRSSACAATLRALEGLRRTRQATTYGALLGG